MKKKIFFFIIFLISLRLLLPFLDLYPYKLCKNYLLIGKCCDNYMLKNGVFGKTLVNNMNRRAEWIINSDDIYGNKGNGHYFFINSVNDSVNDFSSLSDLNLFLNKRGLENFDISKSENLTHLKYGLGRNRKYN